MRHFHLDALTGIQAVITEPHMMVHSGYMFHTVHLFQGVTDSSSVDLLLSIPADVFPHFHRSRINLGRGDVMLDIYEGTAVSNAGTALAQFNTNRNSPFVPQVIHTHTPTVTGLGTLVHRVWIPPTATGNGQSATGFVGASEGEEWILPPSTDYLRRITNNSGSTIDVWIEHLWYEIGAAA